MSTQLREREMERLKELELQLLKMARSLPKIKEDCGLPQYLRSMLAGKTKNGTTLRAAFGFPGPAGCLRLVALLSSSSEIATPLVGLVAQRMYHFLWRFRYTLRQLTDSQGDRDELLATADGLSALCARYVLAKRPKLSDLESDPRPIPESVADPLLYATLRAFEYEKEEQELPITLEERNQFRNKALNDTLELLKRAIQEKKVDDGSNAWWALREGLSSDPERFIDLVAPVIKHFSNIVLPAREVLLKSFVPEIYTDVRCAAYTISNIHAIFAEGPPLSKELENNLDKIARNMTQTLTQSSPSKHLYLSAVHFEGLKFSMTFSAEKQFRQMRHKGQIALSESQPIGKFVCVEPTLQDKIRRLKEWTKTENARKKRNAVLVYGASSTGKSFLVQQFFEESGQATVYKANRLIVTSKTKPDELISFLASISAAPSAESPRLIHIDEFDVEVNQSLYPFMLKLLDTGSLENGMMLDNFVLFLSGGKHGSVESLRIILEQNQKSKKLQKGLDVYNRVPRSDK